MNQILCLFDICGVVDFGWLKSKYMFFFGFYFDLNYIGFGVLCVINEDKVVFFVGFLIYLYEDMEIIFYVVFGGLEYKDFIGMGLVICFGEFQCMSVGIGVWYSEYNVFDIDLVYFLQIWIVLNEDGLNFSYEQKVFLEGEWQNVLWLIGFKDGWDGLVFIYQDVDFYGLLLFVDKSFVFDIVLGCKVWIQVIKGKLNVNEQQFDVGDGIGFFVLGVLVLVVQEDMEFLFFDLVV